MSEYSGKSKRFKNALVTLLTAIQYDAGEGPEAAFTGVYDNNRQAFDGYPNVQVLPGNEAITRPTAGQSDKAPDYIIRTRIQMEDTDQSQSSAFDQMYDLSDLIIDSINHADQVSSLSDTLGDLGVYMMDISRGEWIEMETPGGLNLTFDLNVSITYSQDLH